MDWDSMVWYIQCVPKHAFIQWMVIHEKLLTQDKLLKWNPAAVLKCALCEETKDSQEHMFFKCKYSKNVWERVQEMLIKSFSQNWQEVIKEMSKVKK